MLFVSLLSQRLSPWCSLHALLQCCCGNDSCVSQSAFHFLHWLYCKMFPFFRKSQSFVFLFLIFHPDYCLIFPFCWRSTFSFVCYMRLMWQAIEDVLPPVVNQHLQLTWKDLQLYIAFIWFYVTHWKLHVKKIFIIDVIDCVSNLPMLKTMLCESSFVLWGHFICWHLKILRM